MGTRLEVLACLLAALALGCQGAPRVAGQGPPPRSPYLLLLGTAQDGGYPQIGCRAPLCNAARSDPRLGRCVASALVVDPRTGRRWLIDATPDLPRQVEMARGHGAATTDAPGRPPLFDGIFLTHAHMGHYAGLVHLGREAYGSDETPCYASARMGEYLRSNGPWSLLFDEGRLRHVELRAGQAVHLADGLSVTPIPVRHRGEYSDTLAFAIQGPSRRVLYLPDIDRWDDQWRPLGSWLSEYDVALVDGTFFDGTELPGRDLSKIPHPFVSTTLSAIAELSKTQRAKVHFTHLNHSNPVLDPASPQRAAVRAAGARVAWDGMRIDL